MTAMPHLRHVLKRDGRVVPYEREKIIQAMHKAFIQMDEPISEQDLAQLADQIEAGFHQAHQLSVESIQDQVELALMEAEHYRVAKAYIIYREERRRKRGVRSQIAHFFPELPELEGVLIEIENDFDDESYALRPLYHKFLSFYKEGRSVDERLDLLIKAAIELTDEEATRWEFIAGRFYGLRFQRRLNQAWEKLLQDRQSELKVEQLSFAQKVAIMEELGLYGDAVRKTYSEAELAEAASWLDPERERCLNYSGYDLLVSRYVIHNHQHVPLESVQEMFLGIALFLAIPEKEAKSRLNWARRFYDRLSLLEITMATPTLSNARKPFHQLSSCFIDTVPDSLRGIYRSISQFANVSKFGGGMGLYFGKVRAQGSAIRGFDGAAGGVIRWIRLANDTAVAVDQLGVRQGAVACYLDVWHRDLPEFLALRTNNGDDRMKAHDVFPAVCYPDYFWQQVESNLNGNWALICPHDVLRHKGYSLEDYYGEAWTERYLDCVNDPAITKRWIPLRELVRLIIKSAVETGTPFAFNRDIVNRANPNRDKGIIYCSNLCTEIAQNMSPAEEISEEIITEDGDTVIVNRTRPGEFVVCNLASLNLGRLDVDNAAAMEEAVTTAIRALDNVIELNFYPVPDAEVNNRRYRPLGLGVSGYHHLLAKRKVNWESQAHLDLVDRVFEDINFYAIQASNQIAKEKGAYPLFGGSLWETGQYFEDRHYQSERWQALRQSVATHGLRNGYLLAVAPTSSISIVAGTTPGIDPVLNRFYYDEKKNGLIPRVAPDLSPENYWFYKPGHQIDQSWSVRACGVRGRHIDQAQSFNLYITNDYTFRQILALYLEAYHEGVKTIYYVRSKSLEIEACESCAV